MPEKQNSDETIMVVDKIFAAGVLALFAHGAFRSLLVYGIHSGVIANPRAGFPFLILGFAFIVLAVPWVGQILGLLKEWKFKSSALVGTLAIGLPAWGYVVFYVR